MKTYLLSILILLFYSAAFGQQLQMRDTNSVDLDSINIDSYYSENQKVDELPRYKGKNADFNAYISAHLVYPEEARKQFIEGVVYVSYVIDADGKIKDVQVMQSSNSVLDKAALDVIEDAPKWKPATYKGKKVAYKKISKISFSI